MALIRDEAMAGLRRWSEVGAAGVAGFVGVWLMLLGGYVLFPIGIVVLGLGAIWAVQAVRRLRFHRQVDAPGVVEVDEGQVGYLGPTFGGFVALPDLVELRVMVVHGHRLWRLKQSDGQAVLIPMAAEGSDKLFDAFAALPGLDTQVLVAASADDGREGVVWRRDRGRPMLVSN